MKNALSFLFFLLLASVSFAADGFTPIFNGSDLTGWKTRGGFAEYSVRDGVIVNAYAKGEERAYIVINYTANAVQAQGASVPAMSAAVVK